MLTELTIENFAIIDHLHVRFTPGFTVLTGETGAGKSIIVDALQATLGARVGSDVVRESSRFAAVEAVFDVSGLPSGSPLDGVLEEHGIESDGTLILRREISVNGRGSARLNGRAVPVSVLAAAGSLLVDIHGQSNHLSVLRRDRQLEAVDRFANLLGLRSRVGETITEFNRVKSALGESRHSQRESVQRLDLLRFQVQEIESAKLVPEEEGELLTERSLLGNAERRTQLATTAYQGLLGDRASGLERVLEASAASRELVGLDPSLASLGERLESTRYEIEDIAEEFRRYRDVSEYDPRRLDVIEERLDCLNRLRRKYGTTIADVIDFGERVCAELEQVENLDAHIETLRRQFEEAGTRAAALASELSEARVLAAGRLTAAMYEALQGLGLKSVCFEAEVTQREAAEGLEFPNMQRRYEVGPTGIDSVSFLVSFNPGEPPGPLDRVASGGEMSRFLLALKSVLAGADQTPTLVFDEVDVGIGARHGMVVGERLRQLARMHQVLSITHLPQIAALADEHLTVIKRTAGTRTVVDVRAVDNDDRILEIAEMMSGTNTETARRTAAELLAAAQRRQ